MVLAMREKDAEEWEKVRTVQTAILNWGGMGTKDGKYYPPQEVMKIPLIDNADIVLPIRSIEEALKLLKMFEKAQTV